MNRNRATRFHSRLLRSQKIGHCFCTAALPSFPSASTWHDGDESPEALESVLAEVDARTLAVPRQVHGTDIWEVPKDLPPGFVYGPEADAVISTTSGVAVGVQTADCVPILLASPDGGAVAVVHAGWRGLYAGVIPAAVERLARCSKRPVSEFRVAIGPAICRACYEVSPELADQFRARFDWIEPMIDVNDQKNVAYLDLPGIAREQLQHAGITEENIDCLGDCTLHTSGEVRLYHSYRRDGDRAGRQLSAIAPKENP